MIGVGSGGDERDGGRKENEVRRGREITSLKFCIRLDPATDTMMSI